MVWILEGPRPEEEDGGVSFLGLGLGGSATVGGQTPGWRILLELGGTEVHCNLGISEKCVDRIKREAVECSEEGHFTVCFI